jgi:hypothetical protein
MAKRLSKQEGIELDSLYFTNNNSNFTCNLCGQFFSGNVLSNRKRHLKTAHSEIAKKYFSEVSDTNSPPTKKPKKVPMGLDRNIYVKSCVEFTTIHALPFKFLDYGAWRRIADPIEEALNIKIDSRNISEKISECAEIFRSFISKRFAKKLVSFKVDLASRMDRSILGINLQELDGSKINVYNVGMVEIHHRHTAVHIASDIKEILGQFGIEEHQFYSCTTDNAANMLKAVDVLNSDIKLILEFEQSDESVQDIDSQITELENPVDESIDEILSDVCNSVRCAAHTLQLVVHDVLKTGIHKEYLTNIRNVVKKLRKLPYRQLFEGRKKPVLDCPTRWSSTYYMNRVLVDQKLFIQNATQNDESIKITEDLWSYLDQFVSSFKPISEATDLLQKQEIVIGDFLRIWLKCEFDLEDIDSEMSNQLFQAMLIRKKILFESSAFSAAIFLDPRFHNANFQEFTEDMKIRAENHLVQTWERMILLNPELQPKSNPNMCQTNNGTWSKLKERMNARYGTTSIQSVQGQKIKDKILSLRNMPELDIEANLLDYWESKKHEKELYALSRVVLAVPATQVSVERAFSALALVLTKHRSRLNKEILNDILVLKNNSDIFDNIPMFKECRKSNSEIVEQAISL